MNVGLVTNWDEKCAVAEYARNLTEYCVAADKDVSFKVIPKPLTHDSIWERIQDVDAVHFNYCAHAFKDVPNDGWQHFRAAGKPMILTVHESSDYFVRRLAKSGLVDKYVMHDRFRDGMPSPENVVTIPYGIPEVDTSDVVVERKVGTFGCAFPWKGLLPLAYACSQLDLPLDMYLSEPDSDKGQVDWQRTLSEIRELHQRTEIWTQWREQSDIVRRLASCVVIALPFDPCSPITGISASVRLALASKRPLVLTKFFHFADLYEYQDEVYFTDAFSDSDLRDQLQRVFWNISETRPSRRHGPMMPKRVLEEMKWSVAAQKYVNLYKQVLTKEAVNAG